ncbi:type II secretion system protein [Candidatus Saccharibacteria bacterium]|nr:type II secretion system protein [Candidatus Saccharibacteria bacterium]
MLQKYKDKKDQGFTIIEVLIVLAIAGLIILIVFLAVPALQRNSRNTQRRNDVSAILGSIQEFSNNNGGDLPTATDKSTVLANAERGIYEDDAAISISGSVPTAPADASTQLETVDIITGGTCSSPTTATTTGASSREVAIRFWVETSGAPQEQCQAS